MAAQRKKVLLKREADKNFGFLKIETAVKPESRLSKWKLRTSNEILRFRDAEDDQGEHHGQRIRLE